MNKKQNGVLLGDFKIWDDVDQKLHEISVTMNPSATKGTITDIDIVLLGKKREGGGRAPDIASVMIEFFSGQFRAVIYNERCTSQGANDPAIVVMYTEPTVYAVRTDHGPDAQGWVMHVDDQGFVVEAPDPEKCSLCAPEDRPSCAGNIAWLDLSDFRHRLRDMLVPVSEGSNGPSVSLFAGRFRDGVRFRPSV